MTRSAKPALWADVRRALDEVPARKIMLTATPEEKKEYEHTLSQHGMALQDWLKMYRAQINSVPSSAGGYLFGFSNPRAIFGSRKS